MGRVESLSLRRDAGEGRIKLWLWERVQRVQALARACAVTTSAGVKKHGPPALC